MSDNIVLDYNRMFRHACALRIVHNIVKENRIPLNVDFNHIRYQE